jgi:hypothetical protein
MSHAYLIALMPDSELEGTGGDKEQINKIVNVYLERQMAPYDENMQVPVYENPCYCIGLAAEREAYKESEKRFGPVDVMRKAYWALPEEERQKEGKWEEMVQKRAREKFRKEFIAAHPLKDKTNPHCEVCSGRGIYTSTRNPNAKWDWYVIGGRWNGAVQRRRQDDGKGGFNFGDEFHDATKNMIRVRELFPLTDKDIPHAILTPDAKWNEFGQLSWFGTSTNNMSKDDWNALARQILEAHPGHWAIGVDYHM